VKTATATKPIITPVTDKPSITTASNILTDQPSVPNYYFDDDPFNLQPPQSSTSTSSTTPQRPASHPSHSTVSLTGSPLWVMNSTDKQIHLNFTPPYQQSTYAYRLKQKYVVKGFKEANNAEMDREDSVTDMDKERGILSFRMQKGEDDNKEVIWLLGTTSYILNAHGFG
jgi:hypothetical protein